MYAILGAVVGAAGVGGLIYHTRSSTAATQTKGREEGRREALSQLIAFGPSRLRRMCLELGVRFTEPECEDEDEDEYRELYEGLTAEIRAVLEAELRESMMVEVKIEVRSALKGDIGRDTASMARLREEAKQLVKGDMKRSGAVREEVRMELKREIRVEFKRSGRDVALVAEAMSDSREEIRERLRAEMKEGVKRELRREMSGNVQRELRRELKVRVIKKSETKLRSEKRNTKTERFLETPASGQTLDTVLSGTKRR